MYLRYNKRRGHRYYSIVESQRSGDRIRQKKILYLGRLDNRELAEITELEGKIRDLGDPQLQSDFIRVLLGLGYSVMDLLGAEKSLHFGEVITFYKIAELIDIPGIIRGIIPKGGGPDIGKMITIMAISQALAPTSKRDLRNWYEETALPFITNISPADVEEWNLYSGMSYLTDERIEQIEIRITESLIEKFDINMETCLYDLTSTFFYSSRDEFKKHGYGRDHMPHLVQVVIGLALTREEGLPIKHWVYPGNTTDVTVLPKAAGTLHQLYGEYDLTLVFDRGDLSEKNVRILDGLHYEFICGLKRNTIAVKDAIREARDKGSFEPMKTITDDGGRKYTIHGTSLIRSLWGKTRKIVVIYSELLAISEKKSREKAIERARDELNILQKKAKEKTYSHDKLVIDLHDILEGVSKYFHVRIIDHPPMTVLWIDKTDEGRAQDQRQFRWIDQRLERLKDKVSDMSPDEVREELKRTLGNKKRYYRYRVRQVSSRSEFEWGLKREVVEQSGEFDGYYAIMSTNTGISMKDIIEINDSRDIAEKGFQTLKHPVRIRPIRHWVPQKVKAHIYICILGYLLRQMLKLLLKRRGLNYSIDEALVALRRVKLIQFGNRENCHLKLTHLNEIQRQLFDLVGLPYQFQGIGK